MKGVYYSSKVTKSVFVDYGSLSPEHQRLYEKSRDYVSSQHPIKCVCGRLCTGLHEQSCGKFRAAVNRHFLKTVQGVQNEKSE
jgi:hypothetical protein